MLTFRALALRRSEYIAIYCTHHPTQHTSKTRNSLDCDVFVVTTLTSEKAEELCQYFKTRGYPDPVIHNSKHRAQTVHPQPAPLSSHNKLEGRIPLTLIFHPHFSQTHHLKKIQVTSARSHHCRDFCATTSHFIQTGQKLQQFPS